MDLTRVETWPQEPSPSRSRRNRMAARMAAAREVLGWPRREMSRQCGIGESRLRVLEEGSALIPEGLLEWIERLANFHKENPPPLIAARVDD